MTRFQKLSLLYGLGLIGIAGSDAWRISSGPRTNPIFRTFARGGSLTGDNAPSNLESAESASDDSGGQDKGTEIESSDLRGSSGTDDEVVEDDASEPIARTDDAVVEEQLLVDDPTIDDDSSANVDRMEYADAYDEEEEERSSVDYSTPKYTYRSLAADTTAPAPVPTSQSSSTKLERAGEQIDENTDDDNPKIKLSSMVTDEMKKVMTRDLKYTSRDLELIRPEIASIVVAKNVRRPSEGLPPNWYKEESVVSRSVSKANIISRRVVGSLIVGAVAIAGGSKISEMDFSALANTRLSISWGKSKQVDPSPRRQEYPFQSSSSGIDGAGSELAVQQEELEGEVPDHSVRPGQAPAIEPVDELWLDKVITAVLSALKKLFSL